MERKADAEPASQMCFVVWDIAHYPEGVDALGRAGVVATLTAVLQTQKAKTSVVYPACAALSQLVMMDGLRVQMAERDCEGVAAVIEALRRCDGDLQVASAACSLLSRLAIEAAAVLMLTHDGTLAVVAALRRHESNVVVVKSGLQFLNNVLSQAAHASAVYKGGAVAAALEAMRKHRDDGAVVQVGCCVIQDFLDPAMKDDELRRSMQRECVSLAKELSLALRTYGRQPLLALQASFALANLIKDASPAEKASMLKDGAAHAVAATLKHNRDSAQIVSAACAAVMNLAPDAASNSGSAREISQAALALPLAAALRASLSHGSDAAAADVCGAMEALTHVPGETANLTRLNCAGDVAMALDRRKSDFKAAAKCCLLLSNLAISQDSEPSLTRVNAAELVIGALKAHETDVRLVSAAATALSRPGFYGAPITVDAAKTLLRALERFEADELAFTTIALALQSLAAGSPANQELLRSEGAVRAVLAAAPAHEASVECADAVCSVVRNLGRVDSEDGSVAAFYDSEEVCRIVLGALKRHGRLATLAASACGAIVSMAVTLEGHAALERQGGLDSLMTIFREHEGTAFVIARAAKAVTFWVTGKAGHRVAPTEASAAAAKAALRVGALGVLIAALQRHVSDAACVAAVIIAVHSLVTQDSSLKDGFLGGSASGSSGSSASAGTTSAESRAGRGLPLSVAGCLPELARALAAAMRAHAGDAGIANDACRVAGTLLLQRDYASAITEAVVAGGVAAAVVAAIRRHPRNDALLSNACTVLATLVLTPATRSSLVADGAIPALIAAAPFHTAGEGDEERVLPFLLLALKNVITGFRLRSAMK